MGAVVSVQSDTALRPRRSLLVRIAACLALVLVASLFAANPAEAMQIFVKSVTGKHYMIEVEPDEPIASVRQKAGDEAEIPADEISLVFAGKELLDGQTLADYSIQKDGTLYLIRHRLTVLADGQAVTEVQVGQTVQLQAVWELSSGGVAGQASFYIGDPAQGRLIGTAAVQSQATQLTAALEVELTGDEWIPSDEPCVVSACLDGRYCATAAFTLADSSATDPDPGTGNEPVNPDPDPGTGSGASDQPSVNQPVDSDPAVSAEGSAPAGEGALPATGDHSYLAAPLACGAGALLCFIAASRLSNERR